MKERSALLEPIAARCTAALTFCRDIRSRTFASYITSAVSSWSTSLAKQRNVSDKAVPTAVILERTKGFRERGFLLYSQTDTEKKMKLRSKYLIL